MTSKGRDQQDDPFGDLIDAVRDPAHQTPVARVPLQLSGSPKPCELVEVVADGGKLAPGSSDACKLICLQDQQTACLFDQMPDGLGNRKPTCIGDRLKGCPLALGDTNVQLHIQPPGLMAIHRALDARQRLPGAAKGGRDHRNAFASSKPRLNGGDLSG